MRQPKLIHELSDSPTVREVGTGELHAGTSGVLRAGALGSCVAVVICDEEGGAGGIAHVMLPGFRRGGLGNVARREEDGKYHHAEGAIARLVSAIRNLGGNPMAMVAVIAGGADVLKGGKDPIGKEVIRSVTECLLRLDITVRVSHVGGTKRRSLSFDMDSGRVSLTHGDADPVFLWQFGRTEGRP